MGPGRSGKERLRVSGKERHGQVSKAFDVGPLCHTPEPPCAQVSDFVSEVSNDYNDPQFTEPL